MELKWNDLTREEQARARDAFDEGKRQEAWVRSMGAGGDMNKQLRAVLKALRQCGPETRDMLITPERAAAAEDLEWLAADVVQEMIDHIDRQLRWTMRGRPQERRYSFPIKELELAWTVRGGKVIPGQLYASSKPSAGMAKEDTRPNAYMRFVGDALRTLDPVGVKTDKRAWDKVRTYYATLQK